MLRFSPILLLCALFVACSSDDSTALSEWFADQGIAASYGKYYNSVEVSLKNDSLGFDSSAYMVSSFAALGNANGIKQSLYFGLAVLKDSMSYNWKLRADTVFYKDFYNGKIPEEQKTMDIKFCWREETKIDHDTLWLKFQIQPTTCEETKLALENDTFYIQIPSEIKASKDTLKLLAYIEPLSNNGILRIAPPSMSDISGLLRVAQKTRLESCGNFCLHTGVGESLNIVFELKDKLLDSLTIVFAQLVLPKSSDTTGSELGRPVPVYVYNENYIVDTTSVKTDGHPNLIFWEGDTLKLQVTKNLRDYVLDTLTLRLGNPVLDPKSAYFYTASRPAYSSYDFSTAFEGAKLRLWYAKTDKH